MTMGQAQSVSSLRFFLYDRPLHPELFEIYHDHHVVKKAGSSATTGGRCWRSSPTPAPTCPSAGS